MRTTDFVDNIYCVIFLDNVVDATDAFKDVAGDDCDDEDSTCADVRFERPRRLMDPPCPS